MHALTLIILSALSLHTFLSSGSVQSASEDLTGRQVVVIQDKASIEANGVKSQTLSEGRILKVDKVNQGWLWIAPLGGYIHQSNVVPIDKAIDHYTQKIQTKGKASDYMCRAMIYRALGDLPHAIEDNAAALKLSPNELPWIVHYGLLFHDSNQHTKAIEVCNTAIKRLTTMDQKTKLLDFDLSGRGNLKPVVAAALILNNRGRSLVATGDYDRAIKDYNQAIQLEPQYARAISNRALAWEKKMEYDQAIADFTEVLKLFPKNDAILANRARVYLMKRDYEKASKDMDAAFSIDPHSPLALDTRRLALDLQGDWDGLRACIIKQNQDRPSTENKRLLAWFLATCPSEQHRDGNQALELAQACVKETSGNDPMMLDTLAAALAELGRFDEAVNTEDQAIRLASNDTKDFFEKRKLLYTTRKPYHAQAKLPK